MRLKSSSIYYALSLSLIISLYLGGMILFSGVNKRFSSLLDIQQLLMNNAYSGIEYGMANSQEIKPNEPLEITLFNNQIDSVRLEKDYWGAFEVLSSTAHHGRNEYTKVALSGQEKNQSLANLYLVDQGRPISLCGDTRIEGKCFIPKAGLKRAYIEGKNYVGNQMIYGSSSAAEKSLPPIHPNFIAQVKQLKGEVRMWEAKDTIHQSFAEEAIHFIHDYAISLENIDISGHVIIEARDSIFVGATAQLDQVILKSRVVYIQRGFQGCAQIFASERITLEDQVVLKYPSVLAIIEETKPLEENARITIGEKSQVLGSVFAISEAPDFRKPVQVNIEKEAELDGLLYCQGKTQLKGTVKGSLYTEKFYLETTSSKYENHLLDAKILSELPDEFVFIPLFESDEPLTQIAWLQ